MTAIIAVRYVDGIVMASDLQSKSANGQIKYEPKINIAKNLMWAFAGFGDDRIFKLISSKIGETNESEGTEKIIDSVLEQILRGVEERLQKAARKTGDIDAGTLRIRGIFGAVYHDDFGIWLYDSSGLNRRERTTVVIAPNAVGGGVCSYRIKDYEEARLWALGTIKVAIDQYPADCQGIESFHMTRSGVEKVPLNGFQHLNNQTLGP